MTPAPTDPLGFCTFHPETPAFAVQDVVGEDGQTTRVGVCLPCTTIVGGQAEEGAFIPISAGEPCRCGPGFCATERGLGFFGFCAGSRATSAPPCPRCGAGDQSDVGCWLCSRRSSRTSVWTRELDRRRSRPTPWEEENDAAWVRLWAAGVSGGDAFRIQEQNPEMSWFEAVDAAIAAKTASEGS